MEIFENFHTNASSYDLMVSLLDILPDRRDIYSFESKLSFISNY